MEIREAFGQALVEVGRIYNNIVVISCDLKGATRTRSFFKAIPNRSFEVGIAEANGLGISAGLALAGYRPFISSFGSFITGKNVEIRTSIAYNKAPVVIVGTHGGLIGPDGATQAGLQDITTMRAMPNFVILQPASPIETRAIVNYLAKSRDLAYLRIARNDVAEIYDANYRFKLGKGYMLKDGDDISVISSGPMVHNSLAAADILRNEIDVRVVNLPTLKPIDKDIIFACSVETQAILTVEDHTIEGGLGSMVCEVLAERGRTIPIYRHGILDVFTESGQPKELEEKYYLDVASLVNKIRKCFFDLKVLHSLKE